MADCLCTRYARATEWAALAGARWLGRADEEAAEEAAASGMKAALEELPIDGTIVLGARTGEALPPGGAVGAGGERVDLALDPIEGRGVVARGRRRRDGDARGRPGGRAPAPARHVHAHDRRRAARARGDRPRPPGRGERPAGRVELRPSAARHHGARARPAAAPRPDRGAPERRHAHQADRRRHRDGVDLRRDPRDERPPRDRDRRHAPGGADRGGAALPRRRHAGAALADDPVADRGGARGRDRGRRPRLHRGGPRDGRRDLRRDGRHERRPAPGRALHGGLGPDPLADHVHALQLGAVRRRHPLLRPRAARGSAPARLDAGSPGSRPGQGRSNSRPGPGRAGPSGERAPSRSRG